MFIDFKTKGDMRIFGLTSCMMQPTEFYLVGPVLSPISDRHVVWIEGIGTEYVSAFVICSND